MATDLNPNDVVMWMREQAQWFTEMADRIEKAFKTSHSASSAPPTPSVPLSDRIHKLLADGKARRAVKIAKELGVSASQVLKIVENNGLLTRNQRGWITMAAPLADKEVRP